MQSASPHTLPPSVSPPRLLRIKVRAPMDPRNIPITFFGVTGSFRKRAAKIIVTIGIVVVMIDASTGEVSDKPKVKHP